MVPFASGRLYDSDLELRSTHITLDVLAKMGWLSPPQHQAETFINDIGFKEDVDGCETVLMGLTEWAINYAEYPRRSATIIWGPQPGIRVSREPGDLTSGDVIAQLKPLMADTQATYSWWVTEQLKTDLDTAYMREPGDLMEVQEYAMDHGGVILFPTKSCLEDVHTAVGGVCRWTTVHYFAEGGRRPRTHIMVVGCGVKLDAIPGMAVRVAEKATKFTFPQRARTGRLSAPVLPCGQLVRELVSELEFLRKEDPDRVYHVEDVVRSLGGPVDVPSRVSLSQRMSDLLR